MPHSPGDGKSTDEALYGRRRVVKGIGAVAAIGSLSGCSSDGGEGDGGGGDGGDGDGEDGGDGDGGGDGEESAITWANSVTGGSMAEVQEKIASRFTESTGREVEFLRWPNNEYETQLQNSMGSEQAPDIAENGAGPGEAGVLVDAGHYVPIEEYLDDSHLGSLIQPALDHGRFEDGNLLGWQNGELYAVTTELAGIMVFYNKEVLADAGIDHEEIQHRRDVTWEEFQEMCQQIDESGNQPIYLGNRESWPGAHWISAFLKNATGAETYVDTAYGRGDATWTDERFVTALERLQSLYADGYINRDVNSINNAEAASLFFNGEAAFYHQGAWMPGIVESNAPEDFGGIGDELDFMWWPYHPDLSEQAQNERLTFVGDAYAITSRAEQRGNAEAAGELINHMISEEGLTDMLLDGNLVVPSLEVYENNESELDQTNQTMKVHIEHLDEADELPPLFDVGFLPDAAETFLAVGQEVIADNRDPEDALSELQTVTENAVEEQS